MPQKQIAGTAVDVDENGYMISLDQWNRDIAADLAKEVGINDLTEKHWAVIEYIQNEHTKGASLTIRKISKSGVVNTKEFYTLFPKGPLKKVSLIAGMPRPVSCV